jgi:hypothetical protein
MKLIVSLSGDMISGIFLFIYGLFNGTFSILGCIASNERMIVNNGFETIWKEVVMA